uniref:WW domain-containing protein n=1 Tax=Chromera velia CCMP2878 TaxID=1169474 RepID=A0A0G4IEU5_9ALVE|eukprot:Cvel_2438.t1-p1 / transcript=Cvel_2438.t1 / gene=Cvel_2438 / organism=Chromera_velia_CCMP2878 / gene_product=hypothetical protein / transcript_product=hypothetical protein / location=Cvel_scaffold95:104556-115521(+) / protein_length=1629 / sequence_SO=supercontig / SO=protein_coding / is_pseudo=false
MKPTTRQFLEYVEFVVGVKLDGPGHITMRFACDPATEYREGKYGEYSDHRMIKFIDQPPRGKGLLGLVEGRIHHSRTHIAALMAEFEKMWGPLPKSMWAHVARGASITRNATFSKAISMTPYKKATGKKPDRWLMVGDPSIFKIIDSGIELPGSLIMWLYPLNSHTAVVVKKNPHTDVWKTLNTYLVCVKPLQSGSVKLWSPAGKQKKACLLSPPSHPIVERIDIQGENGEGVQVGAEEKAEMGGQGDENPSRLPEHHAVEQPEVSRPTRFIGVLIAGVSGTRIPMLVAGKSFKKSLPISGMERTANRKWRFTGLGARQVIKAEVLRYFTIEDRKIIPPSVEVEIDLLPQVRECEEEASPASEGDDDVMEKLFGDKRLDEEKNQMLLDMGVGAPVGEVFLVNASPIEVLNDFKRGSIQIPATQEEVARGDFNIAICDEWLRNIIEDKNRQRAGVVIPKWIPKAPDLNPYPDISDADYEEIKAAARAIQPGQICMVEKGLYGMPCSRNLFDGKMQWVQKSRGFKRVESGVTVQRPNLVEGMPPQPAKALQVTWVDDLLDAASRQTVSDKIRFLKGVLDWGHLKVYDERDRIKYAGLDISFTTDQTELYKKAQRRLIEYCRNIRGDMATLYGLYPPLQVPPWRVPDLSPAERRPHREKPWRENMKMPEGGDPNLPPHPVDHAPSGGVHVHNHYMVARVSDLCRLAAARAGSADAPTGPTGKPALSPLTEIVWAKPFVEACQRSTAGVGEEKEKAGGRCVAGAPQQAALPAPGDRHEEYGENREGARVERREDRSASSRAGPLPSSSRRTPREDREEDEHAVEEEREAVTRERRETGEEEEKETRASPPILHQSRVAAGDHLGPPVQPVERRDSERVMSAKIETTPNAARQQFDFYSPSTDLQDHPQDLHVPLPLPQNAEVLARFRLDKGLPMIPTQAETDAAAEDVALYLPHLFERAEAVAEAQARIQRDTELAERMNRNTMSNLPFQYGNDDMIDPSGILQEQQTSADPTSTSNEMSTSLSLSQDPFIPSSHHQHQKNNTGGRRHTDMDMRGRKAQRPKRFSQGVGGHAETENIRPPVARPISAGPSEALTLSPKDCSHPQRLPPNQNASPHSPTSSRPQSRRGTATSVSANRSRRGGSSPSHSRTPTSVDKIQPPSTPVAPEKVEVNREGSKQIVRRKTFHVGGGPRSSLKQASSREGLGRPSLSGKRRPSMGARGGQRSVSVSPSPSLSLSFNLPGVQRRANTEGSRKFTEDSNSVRRRGSRGGNRSGGESGTIFLSRITEKDKDKDEIRSQKSLGTEKASKKSEGMSNRKTEALEKRGPPPRFDWFAEAGKGIPPRNWMDVKEYASHLGLNTKTETGERCLLSALSPVLSSDLPLPWNARVDDRGLVFFFHPGFSKTQWTHPLEGFFERLVEVLQRRKGKEGGDGGEGKGQQREGDPEILQEFEKILLESLRRDTVLRLFGRWRGPFPAPLDSASCTAEAGGEEPTCKPCLFWSLVEDGEEVSGVSARWDDPLESACVHLTLRLGMLAHLWREFARSEDEQPFPIPEAEWVSTAEKSVRCVLIKEKESKSQRNSTSSSREGRTGGTAGGRPQSSTGTRLKDKGVSGSAAVLRIDSGSIASFSPKNNR